MSNKNCPICNAVCVGDDQCIGQNCGKDPCRTCENEQHLEDHQNKSMQEYYSFFLNGPDDAARVLHLLDDGKEMPKAYPHEGMIWQCVDREHKLYLKMNAQVATELGMQLMLAAGMCLAQSVKEKAENKHDPQIQDPQPGSGSAEK